MFQRFKGGLLPWRFDARTLQLRNYLVPALPPPNPTGDDWSLAVSSDWGMFGNGPDPSNPPAVAQGVGDCFWAAMAHAFMAMGANADGMPVFNTAGVLQAYASTGFDPTTGANDNGTDPVNGLNFCRTTGICDVNGKFHKVGAWVQVNHQNPTEIRQAMDIFGPLIFGISCPNSWESASIWDAATDDGTTAGGHAIPGVARDRSGAPVPGIKVVSWDMEQWLGWDSFQNRVMFIAALVAPDWFDGSGKAPNKLDMATLNTDLAAVTA